MLCYLVGGWVLQDYKPVINPAGQYNKRKACHSSQGCSVQTENILIYTQIQISFQNF